MPYLSEAQLKQLMEAVASGASSISYSGKVVNYRSLEELTSIIQMNRKPRSTQLKFRSGRFSSNGLV